MSQSGIFFFLLAGMLIISVMLLGNSLSVTNVVIAIAPLVFIIYVAVKIAREKRRQKQAQDPPEDPQ